MVRLICYLPPAFACATLHPAIVAASARQICRRHIQTVQRQTADRFDKKKVVDRSGEVQSSTDAKSFTFSDPLRPVSDVNYCLHKRSLWD